MSNEEKILKWCGFNKNYDPDKVDDQRKYYYPDSERLWYAPTLDMNFFFKWVVPKLAVREPDPILKAIEPKAPSYLLHSLRFIYHGTPAMVQLLVEWIMDGTKYGQGMLRQLLGSPCQDEEQAWQDAIVKLIDAEVKP